MQQPQQSGKPPMQRAEFEELVWRLWKEDGSPQLQLHSYMQGAIVMDRHYRSMAPASPVEELPDDLQGWFRDWCKATKRNGGILIGSSIREFIDYLSSKLTESKPSPVIETEPLEMNLEFENHGDVMKIQCPDEDGDFAIIVQNKGAMSAQAYCFDNTEAGEIASFLSRHIANAEADESVMEIADRKPDGNTNTPGYCQKHKREYWTTCLACNPGILSPASHPAPTDQALPEEVEENPFVSDKDWESRKIDRLAEVIVMSEDHIRELMAELAEVKETLRIATQNETSYRVWFEKSREELSSARTLILNIKIGNIYQEPADECGKWLTDNIETK